MDVKLIYSKDNGATKDIPITEASTIIGRAKECDLRIPIESCSRRQCELIVEDGKFILRDLNSSNGTVVNNTPTDEQELQPGDRITIGPVTLTVCIDGVSASAAPEAQATSSTAPEEDELISAPVVADDGDDELVALVDDEDDASDEDPFAGLAGGGPDIDEDDPLAALAGLGTAEDTEDDGLDSLTSLVDDEDDSDDDDPLAALASLTS